MNIAIRWLCWIAVLVLSGQAFALDKVSDEKITSFIQFNVSKTQAALDKLTALWESCCAPASPYPSVSAVPCRNGDAFFSFGVFQIGSNIHIEDQVSKPNTSGLDKLFNATVTKSDQGRWILNASPLEQVGSAAVKLDGGRCALSANEVRMAYEGYSQIKIDERSGGMKTTRLPPVEPILIRARVLGPADMSRYQPEWHTDDGGVLKSQGGFRKEGGQWVADAQLSANKISDKFSLSIRDINTGRQPYSALHSYNIDPPPFYSLVFYRDGELLPPGDAIDLFLTGKNGGNSRQLTSKSRLVNGQLVPNWATEGMSRIQMTVDDGQIAELAQWGGSWITDHKLTPVASGTTRMKLRYPVDILTGRQQEEIEAYPIHVHEIMLARVFGNGVPRLRLMARGPDPSRNLVRWHRAEGDDIGSFNKEQGYWVAESLVPGVRTVSVVSPTGTELASLDVKIDGPTETAAIQLLPVEPPKMSTLKEFPLPNTQADVAGWTISSGFCAQTQTAQGALPRALKARDTQQLQDMLRQAQTLCANPQAAKDRQAEMRTIIQDLNGKIRELAKGGKELVVLEEDSTTVGATVKGLSEQLLPRAWCRWSLTNSAGSGTASLAQTYTPVTGLGVGNGSCLNRVTGLVDGFAPGMKIQVELIVEI